MRKVTLVVNLELPKEYNNTPGAAITQGVKADCEAYLHRVGRTGRFGDQGIALNFVCDSEQESIHQQLLEFYKMPMDEINLADLTKINTQLASISNFNTVKRELMEENI